MTPSSVDASLSGHGGCRQASIGNDRLISEYLGSLVVCESVGTGVVLNS